MYPGPGQPPRRSGMSGGAIAGLVIGIVVVVVLVASVLFYALGSKTGTNRSTTASASGVSVPTVPAAPTPTVPVDDGWATETVPSGAFSVTMPGPTDSTSQSVPIGAKSLEMGVLIADHGDEMEMVADYAMPAGFDVHNFDLRASANGALAGMGSDGVVTSFTPGNVGFLNGASFTGTASRDGLHFMVEAKLVTLDGHAAMLAVVYLEDATVDAHATLTRMVESFTPH